MYFKMQNAGQLGGVLLLLWLHCYKVSCQAPAPAPAPVYYDYTNGTNGPANWGNLNFPDWVDCKNGTHQSPINIRGYSTLNKSLDVVYTSELVAAEIYNNGHTPTVEILDQDAGILTISSVEYELVDFHFHIPSEHLIRGHSFPMELHLVHESADGKVAVIALLYKLGPASEFLAQFFDNLPSFTTPNERTSIEITLPVLKHHSYFRYNGSLTTPPCSENVLWTILNHFPTLSTHQLQQLRAAMPEENARPIQPKNGRIVYLCKK